MAWLDDVALDVVAADPPPAAAAAATGALAN
jgi:hypothetical protein